MNLKERGFTVGDLLIISVIVISTLFFINKFKESENRANLHLSSKEIFSIVIS